MSFYQVEYQVYYVWFVYSHVLERDVIIQELPGLKYNYGHLNLLFIALFRSQFHLAVENFQILFFSANFASIRVSPSQILAVSLSICEVENNRKDSNASVVHPGVVWLGVQSLHLLFPICWIWGRNDANRATIQEDFRSEVPDRVPAEAAQRVVCRIPRL